MCQSNYSKMSKVNNLQCPHPLQKWCNISQNWFLADSESGIVPQYPEKASLKERPGVHPFRPLLSSWGTFSTWQRENNSLRLSLAGCTHTRTAPNGDPEPDAAACVRDVVCLARCVCRRRSSITSCLSWCFMWQWGPHTCSMRCYMEGLGHHVYDPLGFFFLFFFNPLQGLCHLSISAGSRMSHYTIALQVIRDQLGWVLCFSI